MGKYERVVEKLKKYDQMQLLKYYPELDDEKKEALLDQVEALDLTVIDAEAVGDKPRGVIEPLKTMTLSEIEAKRELYYTTGIEAIKNGRLGCVLLAGGMGTRLGSDDPKGMYDIGLTKHVYIFQRLIENMMDVVKDTGEWVYLFIMTSDKNHEATTRFLKEKNYFGYDEEHIRFFKQDIAPAVDENGKVFLEDKGVAAFSPNGNGGWFTSLRSAGLLDMILEKKIDLLNCFAVDNVLQRIADPVFTGAVISENAQSGEKVVKKAARDEKVGVVCLEDGRPSIIEYYDMTDELMDMKDENGEPVYNYGVILNYIFRTDALLRVADEKLPIHRVKKKIKHIDENGNIVNPGEPNGFKFETLILDMIHEMDSCISFEVVREKEFAPIKNLTGVDSVESARELCKKNGIKL